MNQRKKVTYSKSGVELADDFRDNLIVDSDHPCFAGMRAKKTDHLRSENSEDALSWNVFRSLHHIEHATWLQHIANTAFGKPLDLSEKTEIKLWETMPRPASLREGNTEMDIMLENPKWVWCFEAKYKSDISMSTTYGKNRDQVLRNIDVGSDYAKSRDFYFALLYLNEARSPKGIAKVKQYQNQDVLRESLSHRAGDLSNIAGVGLLRWSDIARILATIPSSSHAKNAVEWLAKKGIS